jgi:DNA-binding transcriptional MocR family regulator
VDAHSPILIRRQLAEQLKRFIESGGFPREQPLPSIREMAGFLSASIRIRSHGPVASTMTDLCRWHRGRATKPAQAAIWG